MHQQLLLLHTLQHARRIGLIFPEQRPLRLELQALYSFECRNWITLHQMSRLRYDQKSLLEPQYLRNTKLSYMYHLPYEFLQFYQYVLIFAEDGSVSSSCTKQGLLFGMTTSFSHGMILHDILQLFAPYYQFFDAMRSIYTQIIRDYFEFLALDAFWKMAGVHLYRYELNHVINKLSWAYRTSLSSLLGSNYVVGATLLCLVHSELPRVSLYSGT